MRQSWAALVRRPFLLSALLVSLVAILIFAFLPQREPIMSLSGRTETLVIRPQGTSVAVFRLPRVRQQRDDGQQGDCLSEVELRPRSPASSLRLTRRFSRRQELALFLKGPWSVEDERGARPAVENAFMTMSADDPSCSSPRVRLPVIGWLIIGEVNLASDTRFMGGLIDIFGRSLDGETMFKAGEIKLVPGSSIGRERDDGLSPSWIGFADVDLASQEPGFVVNATTNGRILDLIIPGASRAGGVFERITITPFAQLSGDPMIQRFAALFAIIITILSLLSSRFVPK